MLLCPQKMLLIWQGSPPTGSRWSAMLLYLAFPAATNKQRELAPEMKPVYLHCPRLGWFSIIEPMVWISFEIFFSSHFLNIPTQIFIFQLLLGYQPLSGASNFQTQTTNWTNWNYGSVVEKAWSVNSDVGSNPCSITVLANHVAWKCYLTSLSLCFHSCYMVKWISTLQGCLG